MLSRPKDSALNLATRSWNKLSEDRLELDIGVVTLPVKIFLVFVVGPALLACLVLVLGWGDVLGVRGDEGAMAGWVLGPVIVFVAALQLGSSLNLYRFCGVLRFDREGREFRVERGCRNLLTVRSARFGADEILVIRPYVDVYYNTYKGRQHRNTRTAYRLICLARPEVAGAKPGLDAVWLTLHERVAHVVPEDTPPPVLAGGTMLAVLVNLNFILELTQHLSAELDVPVLDLSVRPGALVETVDAQPRPVDGAGRLAVADRTAEAGRVSVPATDEGALSEPGDSAASVVGAKMAAGTLVSSVVPGERRKRPFGVVRKTREGFELLHLLPPLQQVILGIVVGMVGLWLSMGPWTDWGFGEGTLFAWISAGVGGIMGGSLAIRRKRDIRLDADQFELLAGPGVEGPGRLAWSSVRDLIVHREGLVDGHPAPSRLEIRSTAGRHAIYVSVAAAEWLREELLRWIQGAAWTEGRESEQGTTES